MVFVIKKWVNFQKVLKYYSDALKVNPNYPSIHVNIGVIRIDENKLPKAENALKKLFPLTLHLLALWNLVKLQIL